MRTFVRVVQRGSFSSVARELGLGQPAVSKQVAALEADLGAELIEPGRRGPKPLADLIKSESARLLPILKAAAEK